MATGASPPIATQVFAANLQRVVYIHCLCLVISHPLYTHFSFFLDLLLRGNCLSTISVTPTLLNTETVFHRHRLGPSAAFDLTLHSPFLDVPSFLDIDLISLPVFCCLSPVDHLLQWLLLLSPNFYCWGAPEFSPQSSSISLFT